MREALGDQYVEALWRSNEAVDAGCDFVLHWWDRAASLLRDGTNSLRRFGFVTTNSLSQPMNRRVIERYVRGKQSLALIFAIPDQPWTKATPDAAAVRIAMTVVDRNPRIAELWVLLDEKDIDTDEPKLAFAKHLGSINADLSAGVDLTNVPALTATTGLSWNGVMLAGRGFILQRREAELFTSSFPREASIIRPFASGRDLVGTWRERFIIDTFGILEADLRSRFPHAHQLLTERVRPEREHSRDRQFRRGWWLFGRNRPELRQAVSNLPHFICFPETSRHRIFQFLDSTFLPEHKLTCIASDDAALLAALSSRHHLAWCYKAGGWLGAGNDSVYVKTKCFDPFPFPDPSSEIKAKLRALGEELDATRKRVQAEHPDLTLTGLYNVLEKVKAGVELTPQDEDVKTRGLVLVIKDLHDQIDAATAEAYGWPTDLSDEQILERLVALNAERAKEEAQNFVRWLRPDYQEPRFGKQAPAQKTGDLDLEDKVVALDKDLPAFPKDRYEQPLAIEAALAAHAQPLDAAGIARLFKGKATEARAKRIGEVLTTLARYGRIIALDGGRYAARRAA